MVAINKFVVIAVVAAVLVSAVCAQKDEQPASQDGGVRAFGRKLVDSGASLLSHIPIVNKFFGNSTETTAAADSVTEASVEKTEATEEQAPVEAPAQEDAAADKTQEQTPAETSAEAPAQQEEAQADGQAQDSQ